MKTPTTMKRITDEQRRHAMASGVAPHGCHFLVIAKNTDGRVCGWGKALLRTDASRVAVEQWDQHCCYPGEERDERLEIHIVDDAPVDSYRAR